MDYLSLLGSCVMVFSPIIPYIPQSLQMIKTKTSEGFSSYVCLVLLIANILRVCFWYGKRFGMDLLFQSIVMILAQLLMLRIWFEYKNKSNNQGLLLNNKESFWNWNSYTPYIIYTFGFIIISSISTLLLSSFSFYVEIIGFFALAIESLLGTPQAYSNFNRKSTIGMNWGMIGGWFLGDSFKTFWFIYQGEPLQFLMCGIIQLSVDIIIVIQVFLYSKNNRKDKKLS